MRSRPDCSYSMRSKRSPSRPTDGPSAPPPPRPPAATPICDALSSPTIRLSSRRISDGVCAPAMRGRVLGAHGVPVHAVELVVVEAVAHVGPRLAEDLHLLLREVDVELGGDGDGPRHARLDRHHRDASLLEIEDLAAVRRELRVGLGAGRRRQLAGDRRLARQLVERIDVEVLLALCRRREQQRPAVGADRLRGHIDADRQEAQAPADVVEDDVDWLRRIARRLGVTVAIGRGPALAAGRAQASRARSP